MVFCVAFCSEEWQSYFCSDLIGPSLWLSPLGLWCGKSCSLPLVHKWCVRLSAYMSEPFHLFGFSHFDNRYFLIVSFFWYASKLLLLNWGIKTFSLFSSWDWKDQCTEKSHLQFEAEISFARYTVSLSSESCGCESDSSVFVGFDIWNWTQGKQMHLIFSMLLPWIVMWFCEKVRTLQFMKTKD